MTQWLKDKFGRLVTFVGVATMGLDLTPVADQVKDLIGKHAFSALAVGLFLLSYARHQQAAKVINSIQAKDLT